MIIVKSLAKLCVIRSRTSVAHLMIESSTGAVRTDIPLLWVGHYFGDFLFLVVLLLKTLLLNVEQLKLMFFVIQLLLAGICKSVNHW